MQNIDYEKRIHKLCDAIDIIAEFESGDHRELKRAIRNEIERTEKIIEGLENISRI